MDNVDSSRVQAVHAAILGVHSMPTRLPQHYKLRAAEPLATSPCIVDPSPPIAPLLLAFAPPPSVKTSTIASLCTSAPFSSQGSRSVAAPHPPCATATACPCRALLPPASHGHTPAPLPTPPPPSPGLLATNRTLPLIVLLRTYHWRLRPDQIPAIIVLLRHG
jgi:hypothetical protein